MKNSRRSAMRSSSSVMRFCSFEKIFVGLELRIILSHGKQSAKSARHLQLGDSFLANAGSAHRGRPSLGDRKKSLLLVLHVSLDGLDEVGDFVVALLQQHIDVGPGAVVLVAQAHEAVVENDGVDKDSSDKQEERQSGNHAAAHRHLGSVKVQQKGGASDGECGLYPEVGSRLLSREPRRAGRRIATDTPLA